MRHLALGWLTLIGCAVTLWAEIDATPTAATAPAPVTVTARVDHPEVTIGDPIRYTVQISAPPDYKLVVPVLSGAIGEFNITDFGELPSKKENGRAIATRWYTLTTFATGEHMIPAPQVQYVAAGAATDIKDSKDLKDLPTVSGNSVTVTVASVLARDKNASDIRDIKPPEEVPFDWRPYGMGAGMLLVLAALGGAFYFLLNRPRRKYVAPPIPASELALRALQKLRGRRYIEEGNFQAYYVELSAIARRYLEDGLHLRAPEMTTEEFLAAAGRDSRLSAMQRRLLADFLAQADLVKFARYQPTLEDAEAAYAAAKRFVEETRPGPIAVTTAGVVHAAA